MSCTVRTSRFSTARSVSSIWVQLAPGRSATTSASSRTVSRGDLRLYRPPRCCMGLPPHRPGPRPPAGWAAPARSSPARRLPVPAIVVHHADVVQRGRLTGPVPDLPVDGQRLLVVAERGRPVPDGRRAQADVVQRGRLTGPVADLPEDGQRLLVVAQAVCRMGTACSSGRARPASAPSWCTMPMLFSVVASPARSPTSRRDGQRLLVSSSSAAAQSPRRLCTMPMLFSVVASPARSPTSRRMGSACSK